MTRFSPPILIVSCITLEPYGVRVNVVGEAYEIIYEALYAILDTCVFGIEPCTVVVGDADN